MTLTFSQWMSLLTAYLVSLRWSASSPSTPTSRGRIPLKSSYKLSEKDKKQKIKNKRSLSLNRGFGSVVRAVASDTKCLRFESSLRPILCILLTKQKISFKAKVFLHWPNLPTSRFVQNQFFFYKIQIQNPLEFQVKPFGTRQRQSKSKGKEV